MNNNEEKECNFYDDNHCMLAPQNKCNEIHEDYCYYKQLIKSQQEVERLNTNHNIIFAKQESEIDNLKQEVNKLREENTSLNKVRNEICASGQEDYIGIIRDKNLEIGRLQQEVERLTKENKSLLDDFTHYYKQSCTSDFKILELTKQLKEAEEASDKKDKQIVRLAVINTENVRGVKIMQNQITKIIDDTFSVKYCSETNCQSGKDCIECVQKRLREACERLFIKKCTAITCYYKKEIKQNKWSCEACSFYR